MTTTAGDVVTTYEARVIEELEFEIPCDLYEVRQIFIFEQQVPCPHPAAWVLVMRAHHPEHIPITTIVICQSHYEYVIAGGRAWCDTAKAFYRLQDFVIRLEPLKPSTPGGTT